MKTSILTLIITLLTFFNGFSQNPEPIKSEIGLKFGYNLAFVRYDNATETGQRHGFHIGFQGESFVSEALAIQVEVLYSQQGYQLKDGGGTFTQKLDYINLPISLRSYLSESFFLEFGPQVGYAISHKEEYDSNFSLFDTSQNFNPTRFDWGLNVGTGFKTDSGVSLGVRYHFGMGSIYDEGTSKNRLWMFSLGFDF